MVDQKLTSRFNGLSSSSHQSAIDNETVPWINEAMAITRNVGRAESRTTAQKEKFEADVCHAYHVLINHGVKPENVILMSYDDVAQDESNPLRGKLFNNPTGHDVYEGCKIDYRGEDVTAENFMTILKGNSSAVNGGNGRVLQSGPNDRVFVYFADHGDSGVINFPNNDLTAHDLNQTIHEMNEKQKYGQLLLAIEAFYALTSANSDESSSGTYCFCEGVGDVCLGDEFSEDLNNFTLNEQFELVKNKTAFSHVQRYGNISIGLEFLSFFQGDIQTPAPVPGRNSSALESWPVAEVPVRMIESKLKKETNSTRRFELRKQLAEIRLKRSKFDDHTRRFVNRVLGEQHSRLVERVLDFEFHEPIGDLECHDRAVKAYTRSCFSFSTNPYAMKVARVLTKLCNSPVTSEQIVKSIEEHCEKNNEQLDEIQSKAKTEKLEVICRIKPYDGADPCVELVGDDQIRLISRDGPSVEKLFKLSHIFEGYETQRSVFERCGYDLVENLVSGRNSLLFTYGVTGSGKTYTMTGDARDDSSGIIPRAVDVLFNSLKNQMPKCVFKPDKYNGFVVQSEDQAADDRSRLPPSTYTVFDRMMETKKVFNFNRDMACSVFVSYVEVYNDQCFDLLDDRTQRNIRTDTRNDVVYVDGLTQIEVSSSEEVIEQHLKALEKRKQAATMLNASSSRSHIVFNLRLVLAPLRDDGTMYPTSDPSQLSLVDLAGSERAKRTANRGEQLVESGKINQSLSVLRRCFDSLRENQRRGVKNPVPYRDSELTKLFRPFFEGKGKIRMIICLNPRPDDFKENANLGVPEAIAPAPMLFDLASQQYSRRQVNQWYREVESVVDGMSLQSSVVSLPELPSIEIDDEESLLQLREFYTSTLRQREANLVVAETNGANLEMQLMERLCAADLDRSRVHELEEEIAEFAIFFFVFTSLFQRENNKLRSKLSRFETVAENNAHRDDAQRRQWEQQAQMIGEQREALRQVADALNDPTCTTVSELRKKYSAAAREELELASSGSSTASRRPAPTNRQVVREVQTRRVREYVGGGHGVVYNPAGYVNARYGRRSKSAGPPTRLLNHEPVVRIPNGTVFQQQFSKNVKHTTQPNSNDFRKCTDYVVTNQEVDTIGRLRTDCFKGDIVPTAGGGHSIMFKDVERLTQESP
ncbi:Kinesin-like protein [Aphelenchoides besseyi]|nr:Kinesin-like protein [Aphelenchoides besseyi]